MPVLTLTGKINSTKAYLTGGEEMGYILSCDGSP